MKLALLANETQKQELLSLGASPELEIYYLDEPGPVEGAFIYLDLLFDNSPKRLEQWKNINPSLLIINAVEVNSLTLPFPFIRINGWPGFLKRNIIEAAGQNDLHTNTEHLFALLNRKLEWVPDIAGFISPRIISMIINEAFFTVEEGVTDEAAIDTAMKLGTNYPYGPFEWARLIGIKRVYDLLSILAKEDERYRPSPLLTNSASQP
jgi:3-hydroxybutyryl-CoA dehydrogenase